MDIKTWYKKMSESKSPTKKIIGVIFIIYGFIALITPFTPGSWLIFVGLEFLGVRLAFWEKIKNKWLK